jgi:hypothetical protein
MEGTTYLIHNSKQQIVAEKNGWPIRTENNTVSIFFLFSTNPKDTDIGGGLKK